MSRPVSFSLKIIIPTPFFQGFFTFKIDIMNILFNSVRSTKQQASSRTRQCFKCCNKIAKGETYTLHQYRYDKTILSAYFHNDCYKQEREKYLNRLMAESFSEFGEVYKQLAKND